MSKAILISIKPKWVAKIFNGEKIIEIRKTMPKCDLPIDVYIYCTKDNHKLVKPKDYDKYLLFTKGAVNCSHEQTLNGKVVAKFTLNKVEEIKSTYKMNGIRYDNGLNLKDEDDDQMFTTSFKNEKELCKASCLTSDELWEYLIFEEGYAWHISNLEIFDKPKELSEFRHYKRFDCYNADFDYTTIEYRQIRLTKAPQSWMFVEVKE